MAIHKIILASFIVYLMIQFSHGATKERLFSDLEKDALDVTAKPSRQGGMYYIFKNIHHSLLHFFIHLGVQIYDSTSTFQRF